MPECRVGQLVGGWTLESLLDEGGNSEVWLATRDGTRAAVKILRRREADRVQRFRAEVELHRSGRLERPGVLPIIDSHLPDAPSAKDPAWLSMPIAEPLRAALGPAPDVVDVVRAVHTFASTLAELNAGGVFHRDIKPENLFHRDGRYEIGDFGLASYPGKVALTTPNERLGPLHYQAPETVAAADTADGGPVDVYALAKTLWVLVSGQTFPLPGEHNARHPVFQLKSYVVADPVRLRQLDRLIEAATKIVPSERTTMSAFRDELNAWLTPSPSRKDTMDLSHLRDEFADVVDEAAAKKARREAHVRDGQEIAARFREFMGKVQAAFASVSLPIHAVGVSGLHPEIRAVAGSPVDWAENASVTVYIGKTILVSGMAITTSESGHARIGVMHKVEQLEPTRYPFVWQDHREAPLGSAALNLAVDELGNALLSHVEEAVRAFVSAAR